jgi:hypothetical protein
MSKSDTIVFSLRLASGDFSSELHLPLPKTRAEQKETVIRWLDFMATGLRLSATEMTANLAEGDQDA